MSDTFEQALRQAQQRYRQPATKPSPIPVEPLWKMHPSGWFAPVGQSPVR